MTDLLSIPGAQRCSAPATRCPSASLWPAHFAALLIWAIALLAAPCSAEARSYDRDRTEWAAVRVGHGAIGPGIQVHAPTLWWGDLGLVTLRTGFQSEVPMGEGPDHRWDNVLHAGPMLLYGLALDGARRHELRVGAGPVAIWYLGKAPRSEDDSYTFYGAGAAAEASWLYRWSRRFTSEVGFSVTAPLLGEFRIDNHRASLSDFYDDALPGFMGFVGARF